MTKYYEDTYTLYKDVSFGRKILIITKKIIHNHNLLHFITIFSFTLTIIQML